MAKNSAAKIAANNRYTSKAYDKVSFLVPKGEREGIKEHAAKMGESTNAFIMRAVNETMQRDNEKGE